MCNTAQILWCSYIFYIYNITLQIYSTCFVIILYIIQTSLVRNTISVVKLLYCNIIQTWFATGGNPSPGILLYSTQTLWQYGCALHVLIFDCTTIHQLPSGIIHHTIWRNNLTQSALFVTVLLYPNTLELKTHRDNTQKHNLGTCKMSRLLLLPFLLLINTCLRLHWDTYNPDGGVWPGPPWDLQRL